MGVTMMDEETIVVAAATYHRPRGLACLLDHLEGIAVPDGARVHVVIVDNSPEASARAAVEARAARFALPLTYAHEAERGIAQARNRALTEAAAIGAAWLAFIDDDEYPTPGWLAAMRALAREADAEVVVGTLLPDFEAPPPRWVERGGFLAIARYGEGERLPFGNTSNVLFDLRFAERHGVRFDLAFALTGGEDVLFFEEILAAGGRIVFSRSGIVYETIVPERTRLAWFVRRWVRSGNTDGRILMRHRPGLATRLVRVFCGGCARLGVGGAKVLLTSPLALAGAGHVPAENLRVASRGWGFIRSAFGTVIEEYRVHSR